MANARTFIRCCFVLHNYCELVRRPPPWLDPDFAAWPAPPAWDLALPLYTPADLDESKEIRCALATLC